MVIGIDLRCLPSDGSPGAGVAHAAKALVNELIEAARPGISWVLFLPRGAVPHAEARLATQRAGNARIVRIENPGGAALRRSLRQYPCDVLFVPSGAVPPGIAIPVVPWVHDVAIFDHPEWFPEPLVRRLISTRLYRRGVVRAATVLAVSECTKQDVATHFAIDPSRIRVTLEGGDSFLHRLDGDRLIEAKQDAKARLTGRGIAHAFILCMGTLEPRKNIPFLLQAWAAARERFKHPVDMVVAGRDGWKLAPITQALQSAQRLSMQSRLHRIEVPSDEDRRDLLLAADLVAVPSLYEGFGLVALEGMQAGSAVIASRAGALPEVVGDAGVLMPSDQSIAWIDALVMLMSDEARRKELAQRGKQRSQNMTWKHVAEIVLPALTDASDRHIVRKAR